MTMRPSRSRRSVLYVPASNERAMAKATSLACDVVILDLEDAVLPQAKEAARELMRNFVIKREAGRQEIVVRINPLASEWGVEDLLATRACKPDAILLPKIESRRDILDADAALDEMDAPRTLALWAMVETPRAALNLGAIAELGRDNAARLSCLVAGINDLIKETGVKMTPDRRHLVPWLGQMVLAGRAGGLDVLDGVSNDFNDLDAFAAECQQGSDMGFDGKTLIHPTQIDAANHCFSPSLEQVANADAVVSAFARPENAGKGVIQIAGRMVERLHLVQAEKVLARAGR